MEDKYFLGVAKVALPLPSPCTDMQGFADAGQSTNGKADALTDGIWARCFHISEPSDSQAEVYLVVVDLWSCTKEIKQKVVDELDKKNGTGKSYLHRTIQIMGTHTHAGPAGITGHKLYQYNTAGYNEKYTSKIAGAIVSAISKAYKARKIGHMYFRSSDIFEPKDIRLERYLFNRALPAFNRKLGRHGLGVFFSLTDHIPIKGDLNVGFDNRIRQLNLFHGKDSATEVPIGLINWIPMHGTSYSTENKLISGDNKGYAAKSCEAHFNEKPNVNQFVAAFANSHCGDISPNASGFRKEMGPKVPGSNDSERVKYIGEAQKQAAIVSWNNIEKMENAVTGSVESVFKNDVDMSNIKIEKSLFSGKGFLKGRAERTWIGSAGLSMMGGSYQDSPWKAINLKRGIREVPNGISVSERVAQIAMISASTKFSFQLIVQVLGGGFGATILAMTVYPPAVIAIGIYSIVIAAINKMGAKPIFLLTDAQRDGQLPKPIVLITEGIAPTKLPLQILKIGNIIIPGVPAEMTTFAGAIFGHQTLQAARKNWGEDVVTDWALSCYANEYASYVTTPWEFDAQYYEGAANLFGPFTLDAYVQEYKNLLK